MWESPIHKCLPHQKTNYYTAYNHSLAEQNQSLTLVKAGGKLLELETSLSDANLLDRFTPITIVTLEKWESIKEIHLI